MSAQTFDVQHVDDVSTVVLPMARPYLPIPTLFTALELFALVVVPVWLLCSGLVRVIFRIQPPPRAKIAIDSVDFSMQLCDRGTGEKTTVNCPRNRIVEFRKNRLEPGLWIHVKDVRMETFLQDVDDATIEALSQAVRKILGLEPDAMAEMLATERIGQ
ncbi:hypothetical protein Poly51_48790 [Rubripirellula tenax]|uniref:Uncharacterized protein n=2 Tax=Rubripirellula tenax TaxID=2528015 RepID=A0A5C6EKH1_9BACT|nr:hypothetical protein Poly51_48790 [Rubripirellula tenax]